MKYLSGTISNNAFEKILRLARSGDISIKNETGFGSVLPDIKNTTPKIETNPKYSPTQSEVWPFLNNAPIKIASALKAKDVRIMAGKTEKAKRTGNLLIIRANGYIIIKEHIISSVPEKSLAK